MEKENKKFKYLSLDIETTGLIKERHDILSIGMIVVDTATVGKHPKLEDLPSLHIAINHEEVTGNLFAINMNQKLIKGILDGEVEDADVVRSYSSAGNKIENFLDEHFGKKRITVIGKNAGTFDIPFLVNKIDREFWDPGLRGRFAHRVLDIGSMYYNPNELNHVPNLKECKEIAGIDGIVTHNALEDAFDVVLLERLKFGKDV